MISINKNEVFVNKNGKDKNLMFSDAQKVSNNEAYHNEILLPWQNFML